MSEQHSVRLPHPSPTGPRAIGTCTCGWEVGYGWGGHGDATGIAWQHVETEGHAHPVQMQQLSGEVLVVEEVSL